MINFPRLSKQSQKTQKQSFAFGGINRGEGFSFGELETSENISLLSYPAIGGAPKKQTAQLYLKTPEDVLFADGAVMVKDNYVWFSEENNLSTYKTRYAVTSGEKEAVRTGNYLVVYPDKLCYSLKTSTWKAMDAEFSADDQTLYYSSDKIRFKTYSNFSSFQKAFSEGDTIEISGGIYEDNYRAASFSKTLTIREFVYSEYAVYFDPNSFDVTNEKDGAETTFKRTAPTLSHICGHGGRLWGISEDGEIKASKYQSPFNFDFYELSAADSYTVETDGGSDFTASYSMGDYILFFKENMIYRITGTKPANFRMTKIMGKGVKKGCQRSAAQKNGTVFYVGSDGVYASSGAEPKKLSDPIGDLSDVTFASGGFFGAVYYVSLKRGDGAYEMYGYDTEKGMWFKSGTEAVLSAGSLGGELWCLKKDKTLFKLSSEQKRETDFSVTLRESDEKEFNQKGFSKLYLKYSLEKGGYIRVETSVNFEPFCETAVFSDSRKTVSEIRLSPKRGDNLRLRISVFGGGALKGIMREYFSHGSVI